MNFYLAIFAGFIQGTTEFLPISSTAHLFLFQKIFNIPQDQFGLAFDASLHLGTLLAVVIFFWGDYLKILKNKELFTKIIVATIPALVIGALLEGYIENTFRQVWIVSLSLISFSAIMFFAEKVGKNEKKSNDTSLKESLTIGFAQSLALIPGISRSGATISAGLFLKLKREEAARFAFLISGPIIAGAGSKKLYEVIIGNNLRSDELNLYFVGIVSSFFFGILTIKYLLRYLKNHNLIPFIVYRVLLGSILLIATNSL